MERHLDPARAKAATGRAAVWLWRIGKALLIGVAVLAGLYLIGVNLVLNTPLGRRLMNMSPKDVRIDYRRAWTVWPGRVHVIGADISGQDSQNQFAVTAETAAITFTPAGLFTKDVTGKELRGDGVTIRIRRRVVKLPPPRELAKLPEIKGYPSPLKPDAPDVRVIGVRLQDIQATHVRELWVDAFHVTGDIAAQGGMYYKPRRAARVYPSHIEISAAKLVAGEEKVANGIHGTVDVNVEQLDLTSLSLHDLQSISARVHLELLFDGVRFLNDMLSKAKGVALDEGAAKITIAVQMEKGVLRENSKLQVAMPQLEISLPLFRARGGVHLDMKVDATEKHAVLAARVESLVVRQKGNGKADVRSKIIRVHGHTGSLDFSRVPPVELRVELPDVEAGDLTFVNDFLPAGTAVRFEKGSAGISGRLNLSTARNRLDGLLDVKATDLSVKDASSHLWGTVHLQGLVKSMDLKSLSTDLTGSWLALEDVTILYDGKTVPNWRARIDLDHLLLHPQAKHKLDATLSAYIKNLQPAVGVAAANVKVPWIAKELANRENVHAEAHVALVESALTVRQLQLKSEGFSIDGQVQVKDLSQKPPPQDLYLLVKLGPLAVGIEVHDKAVKPILVNAQQWYDQHVQPAKTP